MSTSQKTPNSNVVDATTWRSLIGAKPESSAPSPAPTSASTAIVPKAAPRPPVAPVYAPRPLWQTALMVTGGVALVGLLAWLVLDGSVSGLVSSSKSSGKCPRTPPTDKLRDAEMLAPTE